MRAPFPYPGGKSRVAARVWQALGDVDNYVEPFAGSLAVLLARPSQHRGRIETVSDLNGFISNFWRATKADPLAVAEWANHPCSHVDLAARHWWLNEQAETLTQRLYSDPEWFDAKVAGWWVWGLSNWIGSGWCDGQAQRPHLGDAGQGVQAKRPHLGNAGQGVQAKRPHLGNARHADMLADWFTKLADRLQHVRLLHGDWTRATRGVLEYGATTGIFLDPPYDQTTLASKNDLYSGHHDSRVSAAVRQWALSAAEEHGYRIALAGYEDEHGLHMPDTWQVFTWSSSGMQSTANSASNVSRHKERIWFSPTCLGVSTQGDLFAGGEA